MKAWTLACRALASWLALAGAVRALPPLVPVALVGETAEAITDFRAARREDGRLLLRTLGSEDPRRAWFDDLAESRPLRRMRGLLELARRCAGALRPAPDPDEPVLVCLAPALPGPGPAFLADFPVRVDGRDAAGLVLLTPLKAPQGRVDLEGLRRSGALTAVLAHELTHQLMAESYGLEFWKLKAEANPFARHELDVFTDPATAWVEGSAEAMEALLEQAYPGEVYREPDPGAGTAARGFRDWMQRRRIENVKRARYVFAADGKRKDGELDPVGRNFATEGVLSALLRELLKEHGPRAPEVLVELMATRRPRDFEHFLRLLMRRFPARTAAVERILLEVTRYTVISEEAARLYRDAYLAGKAFKQGTGSREDALRAREVWEDFKRRQRERVAGGVPVLAALARPVELLGPEGQRVDLNDRELGRLLGGLSGLLGEDGAARVQPLVVRRRARLGGSLQGLQDLADLLPEELAGQLRSARRRALKAKLERRLALAERMRAQQVGDAFTGTVDPRFAQAEGE